MPSCAEMYCSLSPITCTSRALIRFFRASEIQQVLPIGDPSNVALAGSTTRAPGRAVMMVPLMTGSLQMMSDLWLFKFNPISANDPMTFKLCRISLVEPGHPKVMSSKYSMHSTQSLADRRVLWRKMDRQNRRGPKGSPCCTPSDELRVLSNQNSEDGEEYTDGRRDK